MLNKLNQTSLKMEDLETLEISNNVQIVDNLVEMIQVVQINYQLEGIQIDLNKN